MRTLDELNKIRQHLSARFGSDTLFMSDEDVDKWGDAIEECYSAVKWQWDIRIKMIEDAGKDWRDIPTQTVRPYTTTKNVHEEALTLIQANEQIYQIRANIVDAFDESILIARDLQWSVYDFSPND